MSTGIFGELPEFSWRGKQYPLIARSVGFAHENAEHKLQFRNGAIIDATGARNMTFRYTLPMRQGIATGPFENLFTSGLLPLLNDCLNRTPGELVDPFYGKIRAVPALFEDETDIQRRDGTDIRVEFQRAPQLDELNEVKQPDSLRGFASDARALDEEVTKVDWQQQASPEPSVNILDAINGVGAQALKRIDQIAARLEDFAYKMEQIDKTADALEDPKAWPLKQSARRLQLAALNAKERLDTTGRRTVRVAKDYATTVSSMAQASGMTVQELLKLNPSVAKSPLIQAGTYIYVYKQE